MLPERGNKQQQQQLSQKVSAGQTVRADDYGALREQRIPGVPGPLSSVEGLPQPFAVCSEQPQCYLSAATNSSSSSLARKRVGGQGASVQSARVRCRRWRRRAPSTGPAPPRCCPQSRTALPPRYAAPAAAAAPCAPPYGRSPAPPSPHRAGGGRATSRCGATPARALPCLCARSRRARRVSGT
jgi:hypothetical protein